MPNIRVYIIDDDDDDRSLFCEVLSNICDTADCITFDNGQDAMQQLQSSATAPDYIFLDLNLPRLNGRQVLEKIRMNKELSHVPVIIYSTSKLEEDIADTKRLGANYFITKPSDLDSLKKELEFVLQHKWQN